MAGPFASSDFPGAAGTELSVADPNWSKTSGVTANCLVDGAGGAYDQFGNTDFYQHANLPPDADYDVQVTTAAAGTGAYSGGPAARIVGQTFYTAFWHAGVTSWVIQRYDDLVTSSYIATGTATNPPTVPRAVRLRTIGTTIELYVDGTQIYSVTDSTYTAKGAAGIGPMNPSSVAISQFRATAVNQAVALTAVTSSGAVAAVAVDWPRQTLTPASDVSAGTWVSSDGGALYAAIDESTADDADYDYDPTLAGSEFAVGLSAATDPGSNLSHLVGYRIKGAGNMTVTLKQGTTTIAAWTHTPAPADFTTFQQELSAAQADAISDYTDLRLYFGATP